MKKLVFMFVAMAAISFASCGNKAEAPVENDSIPQDTMPNDTLPSDSLPSDSLSGNTANAQ